MPALSRVRSPALEELVRQFRFASPSALRRQIERLEMLATDLDPERNYPEDWLIFRITGYRPSFEEPATFVGAALLGDLSSLVEHLCDAAGLRLDEFDANSILDLAQLAKRWNVSRKTIERWRRAGLIARRVMIDGPARTRLVFMIEHVERYEQAERSRLKDAAGFSRMKKDDRDALIARARALHAQHNWSLNRTARALASEHGRAHETIRQILINHDARNKSHAIFGRRGPADDRERAFIERASDAGFWPIEIAKRTGRTAAAVRRIIVDGRATRLRALRLDTIDDAGANAAALNHTICQTDLGSPGITDLLAWVHDARNAPPPIGAVELAQSRGYQALLHRAREAIAALPSHGVSATTIDEIERDLLWAARLKVELIRAQRGVMLRALESTIGRSADEVRSATLAPLIAQAINAAGDAVHGFEPGHGGRLAGSVVLAVSKATTSWTREHEQIAETRSRRAGAVLTAGTTIPDWTLRVSPWQFDRGRPWLDEPIAVRFGVDSLDAEDRGMVCLRYGWGPQPHTIGEIARKLDIPVVRATMRLRQAIRKATLHERARHGASHP